MLHAIVDILNARSDSGMSGAAVTLRDAGMVSSDDVEIVDVFTRAGYALGRGIANIINTVDPSAIYLFASPALLEPARHSAAGAWWPALASAAETHSFSLGKSTRPVATGLSLSKLEEQCAEGAACLLVERLLDQLDRRQSQRPSDSVKLDLAVRPSRRSGTSG
jgi:predicted NBD/HSP70 family sugar kinase